MLHAMTSPIEALSALTLEVEDMARSFDFYAACGFEASYGGRSEAFTSLRAGSSYLNLQLTTSPTVNRWGRAIFHVDDVDAMHTRLVAAGFEPDFEPKDAVWGERYFHVGDPDGHGISFARPLV